MPVYKLQYFNVMGLGEPIRFLLSYGAAEFEDVRVNPGSEEWGKLKPLTPFGQMPTLEIDGKIFAQTLPICHHLAKEYNLLGKNDLDALHIDSVVAALYDLRKHVATYRENEKVDKIKFRDDLLLNVVSFYLDKFEALVEINDGYFSKGQLSYADLFFVAILDAISFVCEFDVTRDRPNLKALKEKVVRIPRIKAWLEKRPHLSF